MKKIDLLIAFGQAIRKRRMEMGITQMHLSALIGCSLQHIGNVERGKSNTSIVMVYKIARALSINARDLIP